METTTSTDTATAKTIHPFEAAGLGLAPFRCVGIVHRVGPIKTEINGVTFECGAPGQPMGSCKYCGTGIADCYVIRSADGKQFDVGCDCVAKLANKNNATTSEAIRDFDKVKREHEREKRAIRSEARREKLRLAMIAAVSEARLILDARPALLTDKPHPSFSGKTRRDYIVWCLANAYGHGTRLALAQEVIAAAQ